MRKKTKSCIVLTATLFWFVLVGAEVHAGDRVLRVAWEKWVPFTYRAPDGSLVGLDIEITTQILTGQGYKVEFQEMPWARAHKNLKDGTVDILLSAMKTPERQQFAYFSSPYQKESYVFFVRKGEAGLFNISTLQEISETSLQVGVMRGCLYGDEYYELMKEPSFSEHIKEVITDKQNHKKLLAGRLDAFIQEASSMTTIGQKTGIIEQVEPVFAAGNSKLHLMFGKKSTSKEIVEDFNKGLLEMQKDGSYEALFKKYSLDEFNMLISK